MFRLRSRLQSPLPNRSLGLSLFAVLMCAFVVAQHGGVATSTIPPVAAEMAVQGRSGDARANGGGDPYPAPATPIPATPTPTAAPTELPVESDTVVPLVESLVINNGADTTTQREVRFEASASDTGSGVASLLYIEYEYLANFGWSPARINGWLPYAEARTGYSWNLSTTSGVHYIQAWVSDAAGNVATAPASDMINYTPSQAQVGQGERHVYRQALVAGQTLRVRLTSQRGDADLFVWAPGASDASQTPRFSNASDTSTDEVLFTATTVGVYQIEVHGFSDAEYQLDIRTIPTSGTRPAVMVPIGSDPDKPLFATPVVSLHSAPTNLIQLPLAPGQTQKVFLPMVRR